MHLPVSVRLKVVRRVRGVSQNELAAAMGVSQGQVSHYECGITDIPVRKLRAAALCLGISLSQLVADDEKFLSDFDVGTRLLICRLVRQYTRAEVAAAVQISARQLARYELNQSSIRRTTLTTLADFFEVSCMWFLKS